MKKWVPYSLGSGFLILGAIVIGGVLHNVIFEKTMGPLSAPAVLGTVFGVAVILLGKYLEDRFNPAEVTGVKEKKEEEEEEEAEFDEEMSPVKTEWLEERAQKRETDDKS
ncbi:MAG: hypothetical protein SV377_06710 [Halobacteria archaeon]|nr:hypothetical protein [Halobacteria archaeon]